MKIGIIGLNEVSKFYAIVLAHHHHQVIIYKEASPANNLSVNKIILEESFFNLYIKDLDIFKNIDYERNEVEITEKFFFKDNIVTDSFIYIKSFSYRDGLKLDNIPNIEVVELNSSSINQIKMAEDILIIDTPTKDLLEQIKLVKLNNWIALYIEIPTQEKNFQITKEGKYSIFGVNEGEYMSVFINSKKINRKDVLKIISKKAPKYKIMSEQNIEKYDNYAYKNMAIINTALNEFNHPYRDYSLLVQIIQSTEVNKIYSQLDIYSDIKSQVI